MFSAPSGKTNPQLPDHDPPVPVPQTETSVRKDDLSTDLMCVELLLHLLHIVGDGRLTLESIFS